MLLTNSVPFEYILINALMQKQLFILFEKDILYSQILPQAETLK